MATKKLEPTGGNLPKKYRPLALAEIRGQAWAIEQLAAFVAAVKNHPTSAAFVFHGATGVGKTAAAQALAYELGCLVEDPDMSGLYEIPSGKQDGRAVEALLDGLRLRPMLGSGWRVAIINEADCMSDQAEAIWLDGLEKLPPRCVVIFTTNNLHRLSDRLVGRCEVVDFAAGGDEVREALHELVRDVWKRETGKTLRRVPEDIGIFDLASGEVSFRLALQQLAPYLRTGEKLPERFLVPICREEIERRDDELSPARKAWITRRARSGEGRRRVVA